MSYMTLSSQEKHLFFTLFILSRTSNNTTSQNIGGTNAWTVPPPQTFGETVHLSPPKSSSMLQLPSTGQRQSGAPINLL